MLFNYVKIAFRNLRKNKFSSLLNIGGLAAGIAVTMLIGLWMYDELSFDKSNPDYDRIAQVMQHVTNNGEVQTWESTPYPLAAALRRNYTNDFKYVILSGGRGSHILSFGDKKLSKTGAYFEPQAPAMLNLKMIKGNKNALGDPSSVLLAQSTATALFGNTDPVDKVLKIDNSVTVKVAGIYEDLPRNSSFNDLLFIAPWELYYNTTDWVKTIVDPWRPNAFQIFAQIAGGADFNTVSFRIKDEKLKNVNTELAKKKPQLFLQPMSKWHLYSEFKNGVNIGGRIKYVWMFGIVGLFVLLLACINFMNLSTARSEKRAREVGIRKAIGCLRIQLIKQFFAESWMIVLLSFLCALLLVYLFLPFFNEVAQKDLHIPWHNAYFWLAGMALCFFTGIIAGSYPAFYLSAFQPVKILKGTFTAGRWSTVPRKALVVFQFSVSVALIIGTITVFRQIEYAKNRPIGYNSNGLLVVNLYTADIHKHFDAVKNELLKNGAIVSMAESESPPMQIWSSTSGIDWKGKDPNLAVDFPKVGVSHDYGKTIGWRIKEGRDFSKDFLTDSSAVILNEAAVQFMGLQKPVGETIKWFGDPYKVIGVVKDLVMQSPYQQVRPTIFYLQPGPTGCVLLKINPAKSAHEALYKIEPVFKQFNPAQPFEYSFTDQAYAKKFNDEERIGKLAGFFAILAIFISCLGLFGMASFIAEQRTKEIGVRKVLGASVFNLWRLLTKDFALLVVIAFMIATPITWYLMHNWLEGYAYRTGMDWWIFAGAGAGALLIALFTVSYQSIRAAIRNPVTALRSE